MRVAMWVRRRTEVFLAARDLDAFLFGLVRSELAVAALDCEVKAPLRLTWAIFYNK